MKTKEQIQSEYTNCCAILGEILIKRRDFIAQEKATIARINQLNEQMKSLLESETGKGEDNGN